MNRAAMHNCERVIQIDAANTAIMCRQACKWMHQLNTSSCHRIHTGTLPEYFMDWLAVDGLDANNPALCTIYSVGLQEGSKKGARGTGGKYLTEVKIS